MRRGAGPARVCVREPRGRLEGWSCGGRSGGGIVPGEGFGPAEGRRAVARGSGGEGGRKAIPGLARR